jgi:TPR repeat protein
VTYPQIDCRQQAMMALEWCICNGRRGIKKDYRRFLVNWFAKACNQRGTAAEYEHSDKGVKSKVDALMADWDD